MDNVIPTGDPPSHAWDEIIKPPGHTIDTTEIVQNEENNQDKDIDFLSKSSFNGKIGV